jgi:aromatic ring-opening dioxygenase catalytic subunit (LigB family)
MGERPENHQKIKTMNDSEKLPAYFVPHGGGPWHVMDDAFGDPEGYGKLKKYLEDLGKKYKDRINAVLVISGHWEEPVPTIYSSESPALFYDYYGFPEFTYKLQWPAKGDAGLALQVEKLLKTSGFRTDMDDKRGYDHGTFVPMMVAFPDVNVPVVQLSLIKGLNPQTHIKMGKALEPLRKEGVLIIGSGMSYHNMQGFMSESLTGASASKQFDEWLTRSVEKNNAIKRNELLVNWEKAPKARESHPRSEHLAPLFVIAGAAGDDTAIRDYSGLLMSINISGYKFG